MQSFLNPYLSFNGNAREAMEFYKTVFGGELTLATFKDFHASDLPESELNKIMHSELKAANGIRFFGSDTPSSMPYDAGSRISMSLTGDHAEELTGYYNKLAEGGTVAMPLNQAPWGDSFGMAIDKFGVTWMVNISAKK